ncbi:LuxR C-terminal-related transcriptional regulator [Lentzea sp. NPDC051213]|uniref:helix-turn-helix transcriptional regulator n=1 Tax=Lentzea sp. NPDC051213 TaxID=3364126 RepID=UPI00379D4A79
MVEHSHDDVAAYLNEVVQLAMSADPDAASQAVALAQVQRVAAWGLYTAVTAAREDGASWRDIADLLEVSSATLYRRYQQNAGITVPIPASVTLSAPAEAAEPAQPVLGFGTAGANLFVGRRVELADLQVLLRQRRLITLHGPPGVGKSRLAAELLRRVQRSYRGGVTVVQLARADDLAEIERAITMRRNEQMLLVLDNCEHLIDELAPVVNRLLAKHSQLRVLATSREGLHIAGEAEFEVRPLPRVPLDSGSRVSPAFQLFVDRARCVHADIDVEEHGRAIAELCNDLDGLPLAIEMAAQTSRLLPPRLLLARFAERLDLLTDATRCSAGRHGTLREAIEWSYRLLDPAGQAAFRRLAALPGGFDHESASAVLTDLEVSGPARWALLTRLQAKSLLAADNGRFRMLQSVRAFGTDLLDRQGETDRIDRQIIEWFTGHAQRQAAVIWANDAPVLRDRTLAEHENIRHAVDTAARTADPRLALLTNLLATCLLWRGDHARAASLLDDLLQSPTLNNTERVEALHRRATSAADAGDFTSACRYAERGLALADLCGDEFLIFKGLTVLIGARRHHADAATTLRLCHVQVERLRRLARPAMVGRGLIYVALLSMADGQPAAAEAAITEALDKMDGEDVETLTTAGIVALGCERPDAKATNYFIRALRSGNPKRPACVLVCLEGLAQIELNLGDRTRAALILAAAARLREDLGHIPSQWWTDRVAAARATAGPAEACGTWTLDDTVEFALRGEADAPGKSPATPLTSREDEVVELLVAGYTIAQTATRLGISPRTVHSHLGAVRAKLDLPNVVAIATWATKRETNS